MSLISDRAEAAVPAVPWPAEPSAVNSSTAVQPFQPLLLSGCLQALTQWQQASLLVEG